MPYHVPFNQRKPNKGGEPPIYIGFDQASQPPVYYVPVNRGQARPYYQVSPVMVRQRTPFNWSGFTGFLLSLASPFTAFLLAPLALIFSVRGLRRPRRGFAVTGALFSAIGTAILGMMIIFGVREHQQHRMAQVQSMRQRVVKVQIAETNTVIESAVAELLKYRELHDGELPDGVEGNVLAIQYIDAWKNELRYEPSEKHALIRSAGPDGIFDTSDDMVSKVEGEPKHLVYDLPRFVEDPTSLESK
ncbi:MAG TPA: DUF4190 domain-containing protein [Pirellulaceae bacterium]|nr:DUF4190 domain-containing protein [Pirellulaceae bacterium]HMO92686.1 DUF4190 domain-containing protein [Pirellulaceae bacterium]HMP70566.1 DUF4190 domain-containing protein [Pirellulaceae bacterium]